MGKTESAKSSKPSKSLKKIQQQFNDKKSRNLEKITEKKVKIVDFLFWQNQWKKKIKHWIRVGTNKDNLENSKNENIQIIRKRIYMMAIFAMQTRTWENDNISQTIGENSAKIWGIARRGIEQTI